MLNKSSVSGKCRVSSFEASSFCSEDCVTILAIATGGVHSRSVTGSPLRKVSDRVGPSRRAGANKSESRSCQHTPWNSGLTLYVTLRATPIN